MKFRDLKLQYNTYKNDIDDAIFEVLNQTNFVMGKQVHEIEEQLAEYVGVKNCITCANGTDALLLSLMSYDIGKGDIVFVPDFTFFSTVEVVMLRGATPVFVDIYEDTFNINVEKLVEMILKIKKHTNYKLRAIIAVDLFGLPADYDKLESIAKQYNMVLIEDGAQGFGGKIKQRKACSFGDIATTSFFPAKPLGCYGDGGAIFTDNDEIAKLVNSYKIHGKGECKYDNVRIGLNSRLDTIQAAVLKVKLKFFIEQELDAVNKIVKLYNQCLINHVIVPRIPKNYYSSFAQYTIVLKNSEQRERLQQALKYINIPTMIYYKKPLHKQIAVKKYKYKLKDKIQNKLLSDDYIVSNKLADRVLSLPIHPYLEEKDVVYICGIVKEIIRNFDS